MTYMQWVMRLPEVGADLIAKAKRVEALRAEAAELEDEVCQTVNRQWTDNEVLQAKMLPGMIPAKQEPLSAAAKAKLQRHLEAQK